MKTFLKIIGALILLGAVLFGYIFYMGRSRGPEISEQATKFLSLASDFDAENAHDFFSDELKRAVSFEDFANDIDSYFYRLDFVSQEQTGFYFFIGMPESAPYNIFKLRRFYEYDGVVTYARGQEGTINAVFIREDGQWKILAFDISDPYPKY